MQGHQRKGDAGEAQKGEGRGLWLTYECWRFRQGLTLSLLVARGEAEERT